MSRTLSDLFPTPAPTPSSLSPSRWPGITQESTQALRKTLVENHRKYHAFINDMGFHNHLSHHVLAVWALGGNATIIDAAFKLQAGNLLPAFPSPEAINEENFHNHLGDEKYYDAYFQFFANALQQKGTGPTLEKYVFSNQANFEIVSKKPAQMLDRLMAALIHPLIHTGYGLEFGLPGHIAEGLAQISVHPAELTPIIPPSLFQSETINVGKLTSQLSSLTVDKPRYAKPAGLHAFTVLARILKDPQFALNRPENQLTMVQDEVVRHGEAIRSYTEQWLVDGSDEIEVKRKVEELAWVNALLYGIGGWKKNRAFQPNFFLMHLVTSSIFLPSFTSNLKAPSKSLLLRAYFAVSITWWITCGRPSLDIEGFFSPGSSANPYPTPPGPHPKPSENALPSSASPHALNANPWLAIVQSAVVHEDEHLIKLQRTLAHYANLYGGRSAGEADFSNTELDGAEWLDGTLFVRVAGLTMNSMGWIREGQDKSEWDVTGFYDQ